MKLLEKQPFLFLQLNLNNTSALKNTEKLAILMPFTGVRRLNEKVPSFMGDSDSYQGRKLPGLNLNF